MIRKAEITSHIMSAIKSRNTRPELTLGQAMWKLGLRYRKQYKITGKPDFVFLRAKIAVFCDGDFWHGHNWKIRGMDSLEAELKTYTPFWRDKIRSNVKRDKKVNQVLSGEGWCIIRFWESEIKKFPDRCAKIVHRTYKERKYCL